MALLDFFSTDAATFLSLFELLSDESRLFVHPKRQETLSMKHRTHANAVLIPLLFMEVLSIFAWLRMIGRCR